MNYVDAWNLMKDSLKYPDIASEKYLDDILGSIWYSNKEAENKTKEEKKNGKTEFEVCSTSQHPDDGCIYW